MAMALTQGLKVMSSDGKSLGKIIRIEGDTFLVEKGFFFPKDYAIPIALVRECRDDECWLSVRQDELQPAEAGTFRERDTGYAVGEQTGTETSEHKMTLSEEELEARKRVQEAGEVRVRKEVVTEHRQVDVPVMKEEVHVERVPASSASAPSGEAFKEETIRVPVREEEVEVTKRPRVREEVRVSKTAKHEERRVEGEVRREEARIEGTEEEGGMPRGEEERRGGAARGDEPYGSGTPTGFRRDDE